MPYIGNTIRAADDYRLIDDISSGFNGSETSFALQVAGSAPVPFPKSPQQVLISVNGVIQEPDPTGSSGFNLVGTNIVFSSAPTNGHAFFGIIYATADYLNAGGNFPSGSLGAPSFTFIGDENTGLYRKSGGSVGFVSDATEIANFDSNGITISSGSLIIPDSIIHNGDSNTKIRFPTTDTISFETNGGERARITSGGRLGIGDTAPDTALHVKSADNILATFESTDADALIEFKDNSTSDTMIIGCEGGDNLLLRTDAGNIIFNLGNNSEKGRFDSSGRLLIGTTTEGHSSADDLTIAGSGQVGITIRSGTSNDGAIFFSDGTSGTAEYRGFVQYNQPNDKLNFGTSSTVKLSIDSSGHVLPAADSTYNIGADATRFANGYFDTLYGDGSNLTGISSVGGSTGVDFNDDIKARFGTGNDLEILHSGGVNQILTNGPNLKIGTTGETFALFKNNNAVELYYDNSKRFETISDGAKISGNTFTIEDTGDVDLNLKADTDNADETHNPAINFFQDGGSQHLKIGIEGTGGTTYSNSGNNTSYIITTSSTNLHLGTNNTAKWFINTDGHFKPTANGSYDIGSSSARVRNIYTSDLHMSNEGSSNDVDSTWGDYTIQEGFEDLYLINNRTGKKFKFNLTEVS